MEIKGKNLQSITDQHNTRDSLMKDILFQEDEKFENKKTELAENLKHTVKYGVYKHYAHSYMEFML